MYFLRNLCLLCLSNDQNLISKRNLSLSVVEIFGYVIPDYSFSNAEIPIHICQNCVNILKSIFNFRQRCLKSIKIHKEYVKILKQENESFKYPSIRITDIFDEHECEIFEDTQNAAKIQSEYDCYEEIKSEISETGYYDSETENNEQMLGKFEMVEVDVKKEITEELMIEENLDGDLNLFAGEIANNPEVHEMKIGEKEDGYISSSDSNKSDSQSTHSDTESTDGRKSIDADNRPYKCGICKKTFKTSSHMSKHRRVHSDKRPYSCEVCHKSFKDKFYMEKHKRTHTGEKPYSCEICHKSFNDSFVKKRHEKTHSTYKPHLCDICQKPFRDASTMKIHKVIHSGERPHSCEVCNKSFKYSFHLKIHSRLHSDDKPYKCSVCEKGFKLLKYLRSHQVIHNDKRQIKTKCIQTTH